jgi:metallo-beta-lactamase family protein
MHVEFHGAASTVTGSATLLVAGGTRVLVDCGLFQGGPELEARNREPFGFDPSTLDAVVLTHAHVDHVGRTPALLRHGFSGRVYCCRATSMLAPLMLLDSAKIAAEDHEEGGPPPLYDEHDVEALYARTEALAYGHERKLGEGVSVTLTDAGHVLGSAHVLATLRENGRTVRFGISGDVGAPGRAVVADATPFREADYLQVESTYGDREHRSYDASVKELVSILEEVEGGKGNVLVPAFAIGRTQDVLWHVAVLKSQGRLRRLRVYVDSPLATRVTEVYRRNPAAFDEDAKRLLAGGTDPFDFEGLEFVRDPRESRRLTEDARGALIIAASGMCQGGRIVGHLKAMLPRPETHVVIVGYQAPGTLGRALVEGRERVAIRGAEVPVRAKIHTIGGFSAHADRSDLVDWVSAIPKKPRMVFLVHGETRGLEGLSQALRAKGYETRVPEPGQRFDLAAPEPGEAT